MPQYPGTIYQYVDQSVKESLLEMCMKRCVMLYSCNLDELGRRITELPDSSWTGSIAGVWACSVNWTRCMRRGSNHMTKLTDRKYLKIDYR